MLEEEGKLHFPLIRESGKQPKMILIRAVSACLIIIH